MSIDLTQQRALRIQAYFQKLHDTVASLPDCPQKALLEAQLDAAHQYADRIFLTSGGRYTPDQAAVNAVPGNSTSPVLLSAGSGGKDE